MGVRKAVELALDTANKNPGPIYTFGDLIHNPQAIALLEEKGISVIDHVPEKGNGTLLIRAHGVPPETKEQLEKAGFTVKDATCPRVIKVQLIIQRYAQQGYTSIIIGDKDHPEVIGLLGYAEGKGRVIKISRILRSFPALTRPLLSPRPPRIHFSIKRLNSGRPENFPITKYSIPFVIPLKNVNMKSPGWLKPSMRLSWSAATTAEIPSGWWKWPGARGNPLFKLKQNRSWTYRPLNSILLSG